jgi:hypothetical protein
MWLSEPIILFDPVAVDLEDGGGYWCGIPCVNVYGIELPEDG